jgi:predicted Rossmann fold nucleotide-binding protein DprA/Smf involved in DNA uptake
MPSLEHLIQSIDGRIEQLNSEITSLEAARSALTANGAAAVASSTIQTGPKPKRRRRRTTATKPLTGETAERLLANSDGLTTAALAERAGTDHDQVLSLLRELEQAERVRRTGQRRATRWHAITDEDRIRERAAELASRSRSAGKRA